MKWSVTTPPSERPVSWDAAKAHLRLDTPDERDYVLGLIDVATDHAQEALSSSLVSQTLTTVYYSNEATSPLPLTDPSYTTFGGLYQGGGIAAARAVYLPRGPVRSITSVTDANGLIAAEGYAVERIGNLERLRISVGFCYPLTVVYVAGYATASDVPAAIRHAILMHAGTLYLNRESVTSAALKATPHALEDFYRKRARYLGVG